MKYLVSLVSDQTIPNLLFILEKKSEADGFIFISTEGMEKKNKTDAIIKVAQIFDKVKKTIIVQEDKFTSILEILEREIVINDTDQFIVNVTGGTKLMSLAAYMFFQQYAASIFYIATNNVYQRIFPKSKTMYDSLTQNLTVRDYIAACGVELQSEPSLPTVDRESGFTIEHVQAFYSMYKEYHYPPEIREKLQKFRQEHLFRRSLQKKGYVECDEEVIHAFLAKVGFVTDGKKITKSHIEFCTGGWFEDYIYYKIKKSLNLDRHSILLNVNLRFPDAEHKDAINEVDIFFIYNNRLFIVECKTSLSKGDDKADLFNDTVYKLDALRHLFGLTTKTILCTLYDKMRDEKGIKEKYTSRARQMRIELMDSIIIDDDVLFAEELKKIIGKR